MNTAPIEVAVVEESLEVGLVADGIRELAELQLACVGGGGGEVIFG